MKNANNSKNEKLSFGKKVGNFLSKRSKLFSIILLVISICLFGYVITDKIIEKNVNEDLGQIDLVKEVLLKDANTLEEAQWNQRIDEAKLSLEEYTNKGGVVGVRANLILGDIFYSLKDYSNALNCYKKAAGLKKNSYTYSLAYDQMAVCYEALSDLDNAAEAYKIAGSDKKNNRLYIHSLFNYGRVLEMQNKIDEAVVVYQGIVDDSSSDYYSMIAKSRILFFEAK